MLRTPRRLLARTNRAVHVFVMPRSQKAAFEKPAASVPRRRVARVRGRRGRARRRAPLAELRQRHRARRAGCGAQALELRAAEESCARIWAGIDPSAGRRRGVRAWAYLPPCGQVVGRRPGGSLPLIQPGDRALLGSRRRDVTPDPTSAASPPRSPPLRHLASGDAPDALQSVRRLLPRCGKLSPPLADELPTLILRHLVPSFVVINRLGVAHRHEAGPRSPGNQCRRNSGRGSAQCDATRRLRAMTRDAGRYLFVFDRELARHRLARSRAIRLRRGSDYSNRRASSDVEATAASPWPPPGRSRRVSVLPVRKPAASTPKPGGSQPTSEHGARKNRALSLITSGTPRRWTPRPRLDPHR